MTQLLVDTRSPGTYEDIEQRTPEAEHTGNVRRVIGVAFPTDTWTTTTTSARKSYFERLVESYERQLRGASWPHEDRTQGERLEAARFFGRILDYVADASERVVLWTPKRINAEISGRTLEQFDYDLRRRTNETVRRLVVGALWNAEPEMVSWRDVQDTHQFDLATAEQLIKTDETVAELAKDLRTKIDLPVQDLAEMCGVRRRQFYNLLNGTSQPSTTLERRFRQLHRMVSEIHDLLDRQPERVRAAVLTPLPDELGSFFDVAASGDADQLELAFLHLTRAIKRGETAERAIPPSGRLAPGTDGEISGEQLREAKASEALPAQRED